ncbi:MAG: aldehyde ferredoxin oxidoreductase family protein [Syntrophaceae bacterium]|nr:aldehyde ferredoxin oxidoreductase family protein [Syntrophaceae bacterium]
MGVFAGGYAGQILYVDLTDGSVQKGPLDRDFALNYIGGRGFSSRILFDGLKSGIDPLSPDNLVILAAGPLNGTPAPSASRLIVASKSPLTGAIGDASSGGYWAPELKYAGFDAIVLRGRSAMPVYLWVEDGKAELRPAKHLWGLRIHETNDRLKEEIGDDDIHILAIGPGGENLVRYACVVTDEESVGGRTGVGAVLGSKLLKAVVVRGTQDVKIADPRRFKEAIDAYRETLAGEVWTEGLRRLGTPNLVAHRQKLGIWGAKNFQRATIDQWEKISGEAFREKFLLKVMGCMGCMVRCRRYSVIQEGPLGPTYTKGPEYDTINALGAKTYVTDPAVILRAHFLCDEFGIDEQTAGSTIAMAMELYERGRLTKDQVDGAELVFGNGEALLHFIEKIPFRKGFGDLLAEGTRIMGQRLDADYYAIHVKGLEVDASDPRSLPTRALTYAVATRGSCHLRGFPYIDEFIKPEESAAFFGTPAVSELHGLEGKGRMVAWSENWITIANLMGLCVFAWYRSRSFPMLIKRGLDLANEVFVAATGLPMRGEELLRCGERVYNVEKLFNVREGFGREADYPPSRFFEEPMPDGPGKGSKLNRDDYDRLLDEYYEARGWDKRTGVPTPEKLASLGLP